MAEISRAHNIIPATFHNWKNKYAGISEQELACLRKLEAENASLKRIASNQSLDIQIIKDVISKKWNRLNGLSRTDVQRTTLGLQGQTNLAWSVLHLWDDAAGTPYFFFANTIDECECAKDIINQKKEYHNPC